MPEGGVQVVELGRPKEATSIAFSTVVVMLGVACVNGSGVPSHGLRSHLHSETHRNPKNAPPTRAG